MSISVASGVIGNVSERHLEMLFEWKVPDFFSLNTDTGYYYESPSFSYSGCSWCLRLYPGGCNAQAQDQRGSFGTVYITRYLSLFLRKEDTDTNSKSMTFSFGIRKMDGSLEEKESSDKSFSKDQSTFGEHRFWSRDTLKSQNSSLVPKNTLTLTCRMKDGVPKAVEAAQPPMKLMKLETLSKNMRDLFTSRSKYDVIIKVQDRKFHAHKAVLMVRSRVFSAMFEHDLSENETGVVAIEDCDPDSFGDFLLYLYTGSIEDLSFRNMYHLYVTADKYDVKELKEFCVTYMMRNLTAKNVCDVITLANQYGDTGLLSSAQIFFNRNVGDILSTAEWDALLKANHALANKFFMEMALTVNKQQESEYK